VPYRWSDQKWPTYGHAAGLPDGVFLDACKGGRETVAALVRHPQIDGVLIFTGRPPAVSPSANARRSPGKIVAHRMCGNNPLIVWDTANPMPPYLRFNPLSSTTPPASAAALRAAAHLSGFRPGEQSTALIVICKRFASGRPPNRPSRFMGTV